MQNCAFRFGHFYPLKSDPKVPSNENRQKTQSKMAKSEIKGHRPHFLGKFELQKWRWIFCASTGTVF